MIHFTGLLRHVFLSNNVANYKGQATPEYQAIYPITKYFQNSFVKDSKGNRIETICVNKERLTPELLESLQNLPIPSDWIEFCTNLSKTAKKELTGDPAKSQKTPSKGTPQKTDASAEILAEKVLEKFGTWANMEEADIKKLTAGCKASGTTLKAVRAIVDSEAKEAETDSAESFEF